MKARGLVLESRRFRSLDAVAPPLSLPDVSRFGNDGAMTDVTWVRQPSGLWVMEFNGTSSIVNCGSHPSILPDVFTLVVWARSLGALIDSLMLWAATTGEYLPSIYLDVGGSQFAIFLGANCYREFNYDAPKDEKWHHLAFAVPEGDITESFVYRDGNLQAVAFTDSGGLPVSKVTLRFGVIFGDFLLGQVALPRIYNYVLDATTISKHFEAERRFFGV